METGRTDPAERPVEIVAWPTETARREELRTQGRPRLLVLEVGTLPPALADPLEDWIWLPADERDVFSRLRRLSVLPPDTGRDATAPPAADIVRVTEDGLTCVGSHSFHLPPAEAAILRCLADRPERLCSRDDLQRAVWGDAPRRRRSLDSRVFVLRRRLAPYGLAVHAIRGRGFVLTRSRPAATNVP